MNQTQWTAVDNYINDLFVPRDPVLEAALQAAAEAGLPEIQITPNQGKLLSILIQAVGARRILEIGTLGGYSAIWMARALPSDGKLITLEAEPRHAEVARTNIERAGLGHMVEIRVGKALETLPQLVEKEAGPFDLVFIDADKPNTAPYFEWALKLTRPGSLIVVDNVTRHGTIINASSQEPDVVGMRAANEVMARSPRVTATAIQTVGTKGQDGFAIALVKA